LIKFNSTDFSGHMEGTYHLCETGAQPLCRSCSPPPCSSAQPARTTTRRRSSHAWSLAYEADTHRKKTARCTSQTQLVV